MLFSRTSLRRCYFAPKPTPTARAVLENAYAQSHGIGVYPSRAACLNVLRSVQDTRPDWWNPACDSFVHEVSSCGSTTGDLLTAQRKHEPLPPILLVEGLDGVGKTTVTTHLTRVLGATLVNTPDACWDAVRGRFRVTEDVVARAFYSGANYLAADKIATAICTTNTPVVLDRWWASTAAMAISALEPTRVPPVGHAAYMWPADLPLYDLGVLLDVSEDIRLRRMRGRGNANAEEDKLAADREMRERATTAYQRIEPRRLERVMVPTYMVAVNEIVDRVLALQAQGVPLTLPAGLKERKFTEAEQRECKPY
jgi:thymidylate kinase